MEETAGSVEANEALVPNNASKGLDGAKVATKEGTTKASLLSWKGAASEEERDGRLDPTPSEDDVCGPKAWAPLNAEDLELATMLNILLGRKILTFRMNNGNLFS